MRTVFVLQHEYELWGRDEVKFIGVYATHAEAEAAVSRLTKSPGFRDWPDGFDISEYPIGKDHWTEGFSILVPIHVQVLGDQDRLECVQAEWMPGEVYRLIEADGDPPSDRLAFKYGQIVRCEERTVNGVSGCLVAVEVAGATS
jgi:homoserine kinase type II